MFIAREKELQELRAELTSKKKTAVLVYGKRRVGKSTLIAEAVRAYEGVLVDHLCVNSTYRGNVELLGNTVCDALELPRIRFEELSDVFEFLKAQKRDILVVLDEYQYLKQSGKKNEVDSYLQAVIDHLPANVKVVLCGSYITVMKELLERENPLFGRFSKIIHLEEFDYYDAARFQPEASVRRKVENYAVFGGSPYVQETLEQSASLKENIVKLLLPESGILRSYIENIILKEIQKTFDVRIFEVIGNGKKRYSEIQNTLGGADTGLLDKQLKMLLGMESLSKTAPVNRQRDKKKQFYEINDNLIRFYFTYLFNRQGTLARLGEDAFYDAYIAPSLNQFVSRRFEDIARQYFGRIIRSGARRDILDYGTLWYDDPVAQTNGEFDCALQTAEGFELYECKFYEKPMTKQECEQEEAQMRHVPGIHCAGVGFICSAGFSFEEDGFILLTGEDLYRMKNQEG